MTKEEEEIALGPWHWKGKWRPGLRDIGSGAPKKPIILHQLHV